MPRQHVLNKRILKSKWGKRANKHANKRIIYWTPFWNKVNVEIDCNESSNVGDDLLKGARCDAMLLRPNKAETVVFGCHRPGHKIVWSDYVMQNVGVSFSTDAASQFLWKITFQFEMEKRVFYECFITESKGAWVDSRCGVVLGVVNFRNLGRLGMNSYVRCVVEFFG